MKALLEKIVCEMVDDPEGISVTEIVTPNGTTVLNIKTSAADAGKVIGRQGNNIRALRTIMAAVAVRHGRYAILEVSDTQASKPRRERTNGRR